MNMFEKWLTSNMTVLELLNHYQKTETTKNEEKVNDDENE